MPHDQELVSQILRNGSEHALLMLVRKHEQAAFTLAVRTMGNRQDGEEIAQDAFMKSFKALDTLEDRSKYKPWLLRIVYHKCMDKLRLKKNILLDINEESVIDDNLIDPGPLEDILHQDIRKLINQSLLVLAEIDRAVITLFYLEGYSVKEVAKMTDLSISNVKIRLMRARGTLKKSIRNTGLLALTK